jgi:translation initiation factor IF-2
VDKPARATVLEARLDKAKGPVATVIVQEGTLRAGDVFVSGSVNGRVRAMFDDKGMKISEAGPSMPVEVLGFTEVSAAGDMLQVVEDEAKARQIASYRVEQKKGKAKGKGVVSLDDLFAKAKQGELQELAVIIKADTDGSVEVLKSAIEGCASEEIGIRVLHAATGGITETDINLAAAAGAIVIGFNARPDRKAAEAAETEGVDVRLHSIIYKVTDEIKAAMQGLIKPKEQETVLGHAEVREIFKVSKVGLVAGCMVTDGKLTRSAQYRVLRAGVVLHTGKLASLKRFKEDVTEVRSGFDCGASIERFSDIKAGDQLEAFIIETIAVPAPAESVN